MFFPQLVDRLEAAYAFGEKNALMHGETSRYSLPL